MLFRSVPVSFTQSSNSSVSYISFLPTASSSTSITALSEPRDCYDCVVASTSITFVTSATILSVPSEGLAVYAYLTYSQHLVIHAPIPSPLSPQSPTRLHGFLTYGARAAARVPSSATSCVCTQHLYPYSAMHCLLSSMPMPGQGPACGRHRVKKHTRALRVHRGGARAHSLSCCSTRRSVHSLCWSHQTSSRSYSRTRTAASVGARLGSCSRHMWHTSLAIHYYML